MGIRGLLTFLRDKQITKTVNLSKWIKEKGWKEIIF